MLKETISITAISSISSLGKTPAEVQRAYEENNHFLQLGTVGNKEFWIARLSKASRLKIADIRNEESKYKDLDDSVIYAMYSARMAMKASGWARGGDFGINIGSSRGATKLFETFHTDFLREGTTTTLASPTTTLGNIASWVAHDLQTKGPDISHSVTCSTALHALLNGVAWISSGLTDKFLVGGSEAPLTPFTLAQMKALKIYTKSDIKTDFPCQALNLDKSHNTMVLGEGAALACLEKGAPATALAKIKGIGYATEPLKHNVSISSDAQCFQDSMKMALRGMDPNQVDAVVMHSPGTVKGDLSEFRAIQKNFCNKIPFLTTNKWKVGHTFGASGMLSIEMAIFMLQNQKPIFVPYCNYEYTPKRIQNVLVNAVGFGGNAVSVLLGNP